MKVVAFNGSPRKEGNTYHALQIVLGELANQGVETELIHIGNKKISSCVACGKCQENRDERCVQDKDKVNKWLQKMKEADGILLGSPVHFSGMSAAMKSFLDRAFYVSGANGNLMRHKIGASVVAVRRSGGVATFDQLNHYLLYAEMFIVTSNYWNVIHGRTPGEALQDLEGCQAMRVLGNNMAYLLKTFEFSKKDIPAPVQERKVMTSFIR